MLYFSELTKQNYRTVEALQLAESEFTQAQEASKSSSSKKECNKRKKALADKVAEADKQLAEAEAQLKAAEAEVEKISQEYLAKVDAILKDAQTRVSDAEKARFKAISDFNAEFGVYSTTITGEKAAHEFDRAIDSLQRRLSNHLPFPLRGWRYF